MNSSGGASPQYGENGKGEIVQLLPAALFFHYILMGLYSFVHQLNYRIVVDVIERPVLLLLLSTVCEVSSVNGFVVHTKHVNSSALVYTDFSISDIEYFLNDIISWLQSNIQSSSTGHGYAAIFPAESGTISCLDLLFNNKCLI